MLARSPAIESVVVNVLLSVSPEMGIIALSNKGRAYFLSYSRVETVLLMNR